MTKKKYDLRSDYAYMASNPNRLPLPSLQKMQATGSHMWSTLYPAWNLQYYICLASLKRDRPNLLVETGTNHGCSAVLLAQTMIETGLPGHLHTFELDATRAAVAQQLVDSVKLQARITIHIGDSLEQIPKVIGDQPVDFAFVDSSHTKKHCIAETELLMDNVIAGQGKFYFDNTNCGPVDEALCHLKKTYGTSGWVDFPNVSRIPPGQAVWQPWQKLEPTPFYDSKKESK